MSFNSGAVFQVFIAADFLAIGAAMAWVGAYFCFSMRRLPRLRPNSKWNPRTLLAKSPGAGLDTLPWSCRMIGMVFLLLAVFSFCQAIRFAVPLFARLVG